MSRFPGIDKSHSRGHIAPGVKGELEGPDVGLGSTEAGPFLTGKQPQASCITCLPGFVWAVLASAVCSEDRLQGWRTERKESFREVVPCRGIHLEPQNVFAAHFRFTIDSQS